LAERNRAEAKQWGDQSVREVESAGSVPTIVTAGRQPRAHDSRNRKAVRGCG
jgi:hypothetical protein